MFQRFSNETLSTIYVIQSSDGIKIFFFFFGNKFLFYGRFGHIFRYFHNFIGNAYKLYL